MKIYPDKLNAHLTRGLQSIYLVCGDEPLQVKECGDAIRQKAKQAGYGSREIFTVDAEMSWQALLQSADNLSLFAEQRIIELRMPKGKPGQQGAKALKQYADRIPPDTLMIISSGKLDRSASNSAWYKAIDKAGAIITVWPLKPHDLLGWIDKRLRTKALRPTRSAVKLVAQRVEGNMLAAQQEIEKLALLYHDQEIGDVEVLASVADSSRYSVFDLSDAALAGNAVRAIKMLNGLRGEGVAEVLILWSLHQEVRQLTQICQSQLQGSTPDAAIKAARVRSNRVALVKKMLQKHTEKDWLHMLSYCSKMDRMIKGRESGDVWDGFTDLVLMICGRKLV